MNLEDEEHFEIGIDCPPGNPRPDEFLPGVLADSGLEPSDFELLSMVFGAWTWRLKRTPESEALFMARRPLFHQRLDALFERKWIRGGIVRPTGVHRIK